VAASATAFPFREGVFDYVLCAHSLHHLGTLSNIEALLGNSYHCLKPGGQLMVIDHHDAPQVRLAFAVLFSPLAGLTRFTRLFRQQHLEEKEFLYEYLDQWPRLESLLRSSRFPAVSFRKGPFFFYWRAVKPVS
jgi:ubiquinone/menaquinone biosynthesis C-methylase UbiE